MTQGYRALLTTEALALSNTLNIRPEDRHGISSDGLLAKILRSLYTAFAKLWRRLPAFRGKVRAAILLRKLLGLENQHIKQVVELQQPVPFKAHLDLHSWHEFVAYFDGGYESDTVEFLVKCFDGEGCFLDLGANIGLIALPFALLSETKNAEKTEIYCVEAVTSNYQRLQTNIQANGMQTSVHVLNVGVGDQSKTVFIQVEGNLKDGEGTGTANILADGSDYAAEKIELQITTIDTLIGAGDLADNCSLMKVDLDGYDLKALQGARTLLSGSRPIIYGEFSAHCMQWHQQSHQDVVEYMAGFDYQVFFRQAGSWRFSNQSSQQDGDLLIIPTEKKQNFAWCLLEQ